MCVNQSWGYITREGLEHTIEILDFYIMEEVLKCQQGTANNYFSENGQLLLMVKCKI